MNECQKAHIAQPKLYKLTWTVIQANSQVHFDEDETYARTTLAHTTQTLIVEAVDRLPLGRHGAFMQSVDMPNHGMVLSTWIDMLDKPRTLEDPHRKDRLVIIHDIVPYKKRAHA